MFDSLSSKLNGVFEGLRKRGRLSEIDIAEALREVRLALLEADVALPVVKDFIAKVREQATTIEVIESVAPGQQVIKVVNDVMIEALGGAGAVPLNLQAAAPVPILMVGLQGSGKTTTSGKIALRLTQREKKKVLLVAGIQNLFDKTPLLVIDSTTNTDPNVYDVIGRYFYAKLQVRF